MGPLSTLFPHNTSHHPPHPPKPSSVSAKQPTLSNMSIWRRKGPWCRSLPSFRTVPPNCRPGKQQAAVAADGSQKGLSEACGSGGGLRQFSLPHAPTRSQQPSSNTLPAHPRVSCQWKKITTHIHAPPFIVLPHWFKATHTPPHPPTHPHTRSSPPTHTPAHQVELHRHLGGHAGVAHGSHLVRGEDAEGVLTEVRHLGGGGLGGWWRVGAWVVWCGVVAVGGLGGCRYQPRDNQIKPN